MATWSVADHQDNEDNSIRKKEAGESAQDHLQRADTLWKSGQRNDAKNQFNLALELARTSGDSALEEMIYGDFALWMFVLEFSPPCRLSW